MELQPPDDESSIDMSGFLLSLPDGPMSIILSLLRPKDLHSLVRTCWPVAQRVMQLTTEAQLAIDINRNFSIPMGVKLLAPSKCTNVMLKVAGKTDHVVQQLTAMRTVANCIAGLQITLTVNSYVTLLVSWNEDRPDMQALASELSNALTPLMHYTNLKHLGLAVIIPEKRDSPDTSEDPASTAPLLLEGMPAVKELVMLPDNNLQTVWLINTLCETVVPSWRHSIETLRLYNDFRRDTMPFDYLPVFRHCRVFVHQLHLPCAYGRFAARLSSLITAGSITLAPDPVSSTFHLHMHRHSNAEPDHVLDRLTWKDVFTRITAQQSYHLHAHTDGDCSALWRALSDYNAKHLVNELSITCTGTIHSITSLKYLNCQTSPTIYVRDTFSTPVFDSGERVNSRLYASIEVYFDEYHWAHQYRDWMQSIFPGSIVLLYVKKESEWVRDRSKPWHQIHLQ